MERSNKNISRLGKIGKGWGKKREGREEIVEGRGKLVEGRGKLGVGRAKLGEEGGGNRFILEGEIRKRVENNWGKEWGK